MPLDQDRDPRPVMFCPPRGQRPLFFLHIPKTAGSSTNAFLRRIFGPDQVRDHIENLLPRLSDQTLPPLRARCLSGHVPLWAWSLYRGTDVFDRVTMLRDPWERLVSHINWVARYADGAQKLPLGVGGQALGRIAQLAVQTDFGKAGPLRAFINAVKREAHFSSFDNYQVRMLRTGRMDAMEKRMEPADLDVAEEELAQFLTFGFCEQQAKFQSDVSAAYGLVDAPQSLHRNAGTERLLSRENTLAREVFAPWIEYDMALYGYARGLKQAVASSA